MSVGYSVSKIDLDNKMGRLIQAVRDNLQACVDFKVLLDDSTILTDSFLQGLGYTGSVSAGEIQTIRNAFAAMQSLHHIAHGTQQQVGNNDFFFDAKHLTGIN